MSDRPYLWLRAARGGKQIAYYRRNGISVRIHDAAGKNLLPEDKGFAEAFKAAEARAIERAVKATDDAPPPPPYSLSALIASYRERHWKRLAPTTRLDYDYAFRLLEPRYGTANMKTLEPHKVQAVKRAIAKDHGTAAGDKAGRVLSVLCEHARRDLGWIAVNPCSRSGRLHDAGDGYQTWTADEFQRFIACSSIGEPIKRAAALAYYTGLRVSDVVTLPRSARHDGVIEAMPAKTKRTTRARVVIPEHPELTAILNAAPISDAPTLLTRNDGKPWKLNHVKHAMTGAVRAAGLRAGLSFHGLRKGLTAALVEAGATDAEVSAVIPHSDPKMTARYRAAADQRRLAEAAMRRLAGRGIAN